MMRNLVKKGEKAFPLQFIVTLNGKQFRLILSEKRKIENSIITACKSSITTDLYGKGYALTNVFTHVKLISSSIKALADERVFFGE